MSIEIGVLVAALSLFVGILGYQLNQQRHQMHKHKEIKSDSQDATEVRAELGYIRKGVDDIRIDLKANEKNIAHLSERVTRVEESSKQAHKRIDSIDSPDK
ncbi:hypothetical protein [Lentibacillus saliphilus]|uniref:hypothetical protein n=1 Tax=Lentibacillus saliphilus TaxID=2737028 RepID=UPI001C30B97E|nr:hypothetical protein [Lentibacillus saliphilus]